MVSDSSSSDANGIETHPVPPFIPNHARVLMLGSFPPPQARFRMPFYYPNFQNDMWRIMGLIFYGDKDKFIDVHNKGFYQADIEQFLGTVGIAISDAAYQIKRLNGDAADKHLKLITPMPIHKLLHEMPNCHDIITTGEKAAQILWQTYYDGEMNADAKPPSVGQSAKLLIHNRAVTVHRLPSSSRAYPLALPKKAAIYQAVLCDKIGLSLSEG